MNSIQFWQFNEILLYSAKAEEKKKKDEEKRQKEEEKRKEEEDKVKIAEKRKAQFTSFFLKPKAVTSAKVNWFLISNDPNNV